jgi:hypothetical protein
MLTPLPIWQKKLEEKIKESMPKQGDNPLAATKAWQDWIGEVGVGMMVSPIYVSSGLANKSSFAPLIFPRISTAPIIANIFATAWMNWYMSIQWTPAPPVPPFLIISSVTSSPSGTIGQKASLTAKLTAEFLKKDQASLIAKYDNMAAAFYQATISSGVMISGMAIGAPPVPLVIPQWQIM